VSALQSIPSEAVGSRLIEGGEVARMYGGVCVRTVRRWAAKGIIPPGTKLCGKRFWARSAIEASLAAIERTK
jgi:hypothetical protein